MDKETLLARNTIHGLETAIEISSGTVRLSKEHAIAILSLLKEQEPKLPIQQGDSLCHCPGCRTVVMGKQKYCHECGQEMKWDGRR